MRSFVVRYSHKCSRQELENRTSVVERSRKSCQLQDRDVFCWLLHLRRVRRRGVFDGKRGVDAGREISQRASSLSLSLSLSHSLLWLTCTSCLEALSVESIEI